MPRFVVLRHDPEPGSTAERHWDLMLEDASVLLTWALKQFPESGTFCNARRLPDHRVRYLDYEGSISGGRGEVVREESGTFEWQRRETAHFEIVLAGTRLRGLARLEHEGVAPISDQRWRFSFLELPASAATSFED